MSASDDRQFAQPERDEKVCLTFAITICILPHSARASTEWGARTSFDLNDSPSIATRSFHPRLGSSLHVYGPRGKAQ
jgi:hypothetical protein